MLPSRKVQVGALAGAIMVIAAWASKAYGHVEIPPEIAMSGQVILTGIVQYFVPDADIAPDSLPDQPPQEPKP
jgi:hypothetical protein